MGYKKVNEKKLGKSKNYVQQKIKQKLKKKVLINLIVLGILVYYIISTLVGCKTVPKVDEFGNPLPNYTIETEFNFLDYPEETKYIFLRLYDLDYLNPFYIANLLKFGIESTEINDLTASHVSIGFSLKDEFYGLTSGGKHQLAIESCLDTKSNKFMKKTNPEKSIQYTYALKVSEEEYNSVKKFVEGYAASTKIKYDPWLNFSIASFAMNRRYFTEKNKKQFGTVEYPDKKENPKTKIDNWETHFVCSTFVAYCLINNILRIRNWFSVKDIDYRYVSVTDLVQIPGVCRLFSSPFNEYNDAAEAFVAKNPEFEEYLYPQELKLAVSQ